MACGVLGIETLDCSAIWSRQLRPAPVKVRNNTQTMGLSLRHLRGFVVFVFVYVIAFGGLQRAEAASFAVLVGVSDYDDATGIADLRGPMNDVKLLRDTLQQRGDFNITVLADGIEGAQRPTRAAILDTLAKLTTQVSSGDFIYIHLSGHGTQQPDQNGDESDGLDEVFLPADTQLAPPGSQEIPNAIRDEELGAAVADLRRLGADVWVVIDSCHSGSGLRAASLDTATRFVNPTALGIDAEAHAVEPVDTPPLDGPGAEDLPGKYLAFYAAQASELAREIEVDPEAQSGNGWYGLFSSRLAARLTQSDNTSYRQLFQAVLSDMNGNDIPAGARLQTPLWEGNLIDAAVLGGGETIGVRQFAVEGATLRAGRLHGVEPGTVMSVVADATASADARLAFAQVVSATAQSAQLVRVNEGCVPDPSAFCVSDGTLPDEARFARVFARPIDLTLRLAAPVDLETGALVELTSPLYRALEEAVAQVNDNGTAQIEIVSVDADVSVGEYEGGLWFGPKITAGDSAVGLAWQPGETPLNTLLTRIVAAERVARMLDSVGGDGSVLFGNPVALKITHRDTNMLDRPAVTPSLDALRAECERAFSTAALREMPRRHTLNQCDQLLFSARATIAGPARDINRIYIDSQYCINTAYVRLDGTANEAQLGRPMTVCASCPTANGMSLKAGHERLFVVVTEARDNAEALDLRGLMDNCTASRSTNTTRNVSAAAPAAAFLESMGSRSGMRGSFDSMGISSLWVERFDWQVLPRREALLHEGIEPE